MVFVRLPEDMNKQTYRWVDPKWFLQQHVRLPAMFDHLRQSSPSSGKWYTAIRRSSLVVGSGYSVLTFIIDTMFTGVEH
jgi:hypothetical protein